VDYEWHDADIAIVWAKVGEDIKGFIVETSTAGFQAPEIKNKLSLRASVTSFDHGRRLRPGNKPLLPQVAG
jgi:glutaryl-CoA dehydrogenase